MVQNFIQNLLAKKEGMRPLDIKFMQFDEQGNYDPLLTAEKGLQIKQDTTPLTLNDRLFGRDMAQDYQTIDPKTKKVEMATLVNHKPGFFEDFNKGYKENATQGFNVNNLAPVENKGLATRLGEGLGTLGRFANSPLGRGLIAYGLSNAMGDTNPLEQAFTAGVGRQTNMTRDNVYRNQLKQMGMSEDEVNAIPGIITDDIFKNYTLANYRNNMTNYRNLKLDKDTYLKQQQNIYKMLDLGVIDSKEATKQMLALNEEYNRQNPIKMQEGNKTVQGNKRLEIMEERNDITRQLGGERNDILQQNANTYAKNTGKRKIEETDEYRQDLADYVNLIKDPKQRRKVASFEALFAKKYGKLPPRVQ